MNDRLIFYLIKLVFQTFNPLWIQGARGQTEVCEFYMSSAIYQEVLLWGIVQYISIRLNIEKRNAYFWLEIAMDVAQIM